SHREPSCTSGRSADRRARRSGRGRLAPGTERAPASTGSGEPRHGSPRPCVCSVGARAGEGWVRRAGRVGETVGGRWVVLGTVRRRGGAVMHVRDRHWSGCRLTWMPMAVGVDPAAFRDAAERWLSLPPHPGLVAGYGARRLDERWI